MNLISKASLIFTILIIACQSKPEASQPTFKVDEKTYVADHFKIDTLGQTILLTVNEPFLNSSISERYLLYPANVVPPQLPDIKHFIQLPVKSVAITSTTHLGFLKEMNEGNKIKAATGVGLFYDSSFNQSVRTGKIAAIGEQVLNQEKLIEAEVDVIFMYAIDAASYKIAEQLRAKGQTVILVAEYMESNPLGKAEWIKFLACFFGKKAVHTSNTIFTQVKKDYLKLLKQKEALDSVPKVMIGMPWKGTWYVSGGLSYQAKLIEDAGGEYVWSNYLQSASVPLDVETVFEKALDADVWINPGNMQSKSAILEFDNRFANFKSFQDDRVFSNFSKSSYNGANDYWESGVVHPELILADLISLFHPKDLDIENLSYYYQLE